MVRKLARNIVVGGLALASAFTLVPAVGAATRSIHRQSSALKQLMSLHGETVGVLRSASAATQTSVPTPTPLPAPSPDGTHGASMTVDPNGVR